MSDPINDGGPAFPFGQISEVTGQPINGFFAPGMTLRDFFAGQALNGFGNQTESNSYPEEWNWPALARIAYKAADAMLTAREGRVES